MAKLPAKTGTENPATAQRTDVIRNRQSMPGVQMPGTHTHKIPNPVFVGNEELATQDKVSARGGSRNVGKQTWKGARDGYTTRSIPEYVPSPAADSMQDTKPHETGKKPTSTGNYTGRNLNTANIPKKGVGPEQDVKDHARNAKKHGGEAKQSAGVTSL